MAYKYKEFTSSDYLNNIGNKRDEYLNAVENYGDFKASDALNLSEQQKKNAENVVANYGDFSYKNQGLLDGVIDQRMNRDKFSYDLNGDALYQQYKDKYINQGRMAMQDTIGQASAMTGGYGNSYAATAGNQAYQASLQNLNDIVPQLYQMALDQYNQETQDLNDKYSMLSNDRSYEYGVWGDGYNRLVADRDYMSNDYYNKYNQEYGQYTDKYGRLVDLVGAYENRYGNQYNQEYGQHSDTESYAYKAARDAVADEQWQKTYDENVRQYNETMNYNKSKNNGGGDDNKWKLSDYNTVMAEAANYEGDNEALDLYLTRMEQEEIISEAEGDFLYKKYSVEEKPLPKYKGMSTQDAINEKIAYKKWDSKN
jgi:hypothetical protein